MVVNLPIRIDALDYHEFDFFIDNLRKIIPSIKHREIGFDHDNHSYVAIFYDKKQDVAYKSLLKDVKKSLKEAEEYWESVR